jgi:hypothetical protein
VGGRAEGKIAARLACAERAPCVNRWPKLEELPAVDLAVEISLQIARASGFSPSSTEVAAVYH